jgi:hypothetical protein
MGHLVLRHRWAVLGVLLALTAFMAYHAVQVRIRYDFASMLPYDDSTLVRYRDFKARFGEDGNVLVIGMRHDSLYTPQMYGRWHRLGEEIRALEGIEEVVSVARCATLVRDTVQRRFVLTKVPGDAPLDRPTVDSLGRLMAGLPFYQGILMNEQTGATLMAVTMNRDFLDSRRRVGLTQQIIALADGFARDTGTPVHLGGMPYIRSVLAGMVAQELRMFLALAGVVAAVLLYVFFRSAKVVLVSVTVVGVAVVWCFGFMHLLGYDITILTGIIPPLLIIIGVANCIFLLTKFQQGVRAHGNRALALARMVERIGFATMFTNLTTAVGFATFAVLRSEVMREFGIVASLSIAGVFIISLVLVPVMFSFFTLPRQRHLRHLEHGPGYHFIGHVVDLVLSNRWATYMVCGVLTVLSVAGTLRLHTTGNLVDDLPADHRVMADLRFFESNFKGIMPFEVEIDALGPGKALSPATTARIERLQELFGQYPEFARPLSVNEVLKFARQAYYNGLPDMYRLPSGSERAFILSHSGGMEKGNMLHSFIDSTRQRTRVSVQMKDVGTLQLDTLMTELVPRIDSIFNPEQYRVTLTGTSVVFLRGTEYMVRNLLSSLAMAIGLIALCMVYLFRSWRMVAVSLVPNVLPLMVTAGLMGWLGIAIKPSTILVFSIAFGISVDDTIHYLTKYRQELEHQGWNIRRSVIASLREAGLSMMYTSVVLFCGFSIFMGSEFGGTKALGLLISVTLLVAMFSNLILLPSLLLTFERSLTTKEFGTAAVELEDDPDGH